MPDRLVVDASAALAILRAEPSGAECARVIASVLPDGDILVPDPFWLEVTNVLVRRYRWGPDAVVSALHDLDELGIETVPIDRPLVLMGLDLMTAHALSSYDAAYLALAEVEDAALLTLDGDLAAAAGDRAIVPGRHRSGESRARYEITARPPRWSQHGRYLAELRRRAADAGAA
jgi:predicted nucleic acid-binding protein